MDYGNGFAELWHDSDWEGQHVHVAKCSLLPISSRYALLHVDSARSRRRPAISRSNCLASGFATSYVEIFEYAFDGARVPFSGLWMISTPVNAEATLRSWPRSVSSVHGLPFRLLCSYEKYWAGLPQRQRPTPHPRPKYHGKPMSITVGMKKLFFKVHYKGFHTSLEPPDWDRTASGWTERGT